MGVELVNVVEVEASVPDATELDEPVAEPLDKEEAVSLPNKAVDAETEMIDEVAKFEPLSVAAELSKVDVAEVETPLGRVAILILH